MSECERITKAVFESEGEPSRELARQLTAHVAVCPACAGNVEDMRRAFASAEGPPAVGDERWEALWRRIEERVRRHRSSRRLARALWGGVTVTAVAAAVIVAAYVFTPERVQGPRAMVTGEFQVVSLEVGSPDYDVVVMAARDDAPPVIWLHRL
ncbi:MAG: hypothetical protein ACYTAN_15270 [Planctomycetota bacterium]|jgi:hypothetical protein